jgi:hypothetical protein
MKKLRRHGETLTIDMHLHLKQYTKKPSSPPISLLPMIGNGESIMVTPSLMEPYGPVANIDFESLMFENTEFGEMGLATLSQHHESPHQFPPESSDGTSLGTSSSLSGFSEEATMDPRYLSNTDWYYPGNF